MLGTTWLLALTSPEVTLSYVSVSFGPCRKETRSEDHHLPQAQHAQCRTARSRQRVAQPPLTGNTWPTKQSAPSLHR